LVLSVLSFVLIIESLSGTLNQYFLNSTANLFASPETFVEFTKFISVFSNDIPGKLKMMFANFDMLEYAERLEAVASSGKTTEAHQNWLLSGVYRNPPTSQLFTHHSQLLLRLNENIWSFGISFANKAKPIISLIHMSVLTFELIA
jgi:hypothetical protein